jgi:hypothetical protein
MITKADIIDELKQYTNIGSATLGRRKKADLKALLAKYKAEAPEEAEEAEEAVEETKAVNWNEVAEVIEEEQKQEEEEVEEEEAPRGRKALKKRTTEREKVKNKVKLYEEKIKSQKKARMANLEETMPEIPVLSPEKDEEIDLDSPIVITKGEASKKIRELKRNCQNVLSNSLRDVHFEIKRFNKSGKVYPFDKVKFEIESALLEMICHLNDEVNHMLDYVKHPTAGAKRKFEKLVYDNLGSFAEDLESKLNRSL